MIRNILHGEMYVVQMIKSSERARTLAFQHLGAVGKEGQLEKLAAVDALEHLAEKFHCEQKKVFERLGQEIRDAFKLRSLPPFTRFHLQLLKENRSLMPLASLLHCGPDDALNNLFIANKVNRTLQLIKPELARSAKLDMEALLQAICAPHVVHVMEQRYGIDFNRWGELITEERWLSDQARQYLCAYASRMEWPTDDPLCILAAFLEELEIGKDQQPTESAQYLDTMGLTYLRLRLLFLATELREQAVKYAQDASKLDPEQTAFKHLVAWIEVYEQGAITRALPYLTPHKKSLRTLIPVIFKHSKHLEGKVDPKEPFVIDNVEHYENRSGKYVNFKIACKLQGDERLHQIINCSGLPLADYEYLKKVLPAKGEDLAEDGQHIADRLANTLVVVRDPFITSLYNGVNALGPTFAQCLILCGTPLPITLKKIPGYADLSEKLPYKAPASDEDTEFPLNASNIVDEIQSLYHKQGQRLDLVEW